MYDAPWKSLLMAGVGAMMLLIGTVKFAMDFTHLQAEMREEELKDEPPKKKVTK